MDQKLKGYARSAKNKIRLDNNPRDNRRQQPVFKRQNVRGQNVARAYTAGNNEKKGYVGSLPYCNKCKLHHAGPCTVRTVETRLETRMETRVETRLEAMKLQQGLTPLEEEEQTSIPMWNGGGNGYNFGGFVPARECTYQDFLKCQPISFNETEGVVRLTHWFEKMETVFHISNCPEKYQLKYATCTLLNSALTWWNSHKRIIGIEAAYAMSWAELMKLMTEVYCPRNEVQKMETEL
ncbi:hypothetical protein Tco_0231468 [Tanacetum coccineum]